MDTSLEYIRQCEQAEEIQEIWSHAKLSLYPVFCFDKSTKKLLVTVVISDDFADFINGRPSPHPNTLELSFEYEPDGGFEPKERKEPSIWLPSQDQLQAMVGDFERCLSVISSITLVNQGIIFPGNERRYDWILQRCTSMEQLWLAFVMREKFNKIWDGKEWVA